jgi:hypothetical protein
MRISTKESNDKQSFNRQEKSLKTYAKDNNIEYLIDFKDDISGRIGLNGINYRRYYSLEIQ